MSNRNNVKNYYFTLCYQSGFQFHYAFSSWSNWKPSQVQHHDFYFEFISHFVTSSTEPHTYFVCYCFTVYSYHYIINSTTTTQNTEIEILTIHDFMCAEKDNANFPHFFIWFTSLLSFQNRKHHLRRRKATYNLKCYIRMLLTMRLITFCQQFPVIFFSCIRTTLSGKHQNNVLLHEK